MGHAKPFKTVNPTMPGFLQSLKKVKDKDMVINAIADLQKDPLPGHLDFKKLKNYKKPNIYSVMLCGNHAYKLSFQIQDGVAILRRVGTHKQIDNNP